jgi:ATP-dependent helicase HrpB
MYGPGGSVPSLAVGLGSEPGRRYAGRMPEPPFPDLPIAAALPRLMAMLDGSPKLVLQAPPGTGKTTLVPLAMLDAAWLGGGRIVMLEPRRLAARAAARRMAGLLGQSVGDTVGYRIRMDRRIGPNTRIEVVTDGVFTRMIRDDPELGGIGAVLFDEFHERRLETDLGLALTLEAQEALRPDLRILVMSATLEAGPVASLLGGAPVVTVEGRLYPVARRHLPAPARGGLAEAAAGAIERALEQQGDILVFLPGAREIRQLQRELADRRLPDDIDVLPLAGDLDEAAQDRALGPSRAGRRKIVLSTGIAETSLTIPGIRQVVDCGLARYARHDPRTGMTRLETAPVTRAAAEQRAGRAGREAPGLCWRLWPEAAHAGLEPYPQPEIALADLADLVLELAGWGIVDPARVRLLTPPPDASFAAARTALLRMGALDDQGRITGHGRAMANLGLPPRLAHMVVSARSREAGTLACAVAALLAEGEDAGDPGQDLRPRLEALAAGRFGRSREAARRIARQAGIAWGDFATGDAGFVLALAYPERIGRRRGGPGRYLLSGGQGAMLDPADPLAREEFLVVADLDGKSPDSRIRLAAPIDLAALESVMSERIATEDAVWFDPERGSVQARRQRRLGALILSDAALADPAPETVRDALIQGIRTAGALPWNDAAERLRHRIDFLRRRDGEGWPDLSAPTLTRTVAEWLGPSLEGRRRLDELHGLDLARLLLDRLDRPRRQALDRRAPTHWTAPTGSSLAIDYAPELPVLRVRLQELFGLAETPSVDDGKLRLSLHLLSPAQRPIQITDDLAGFWRGSYKAVRADLRGRYPRHSWPEDPLAAAPTTRARPRR